MHKELYKMIEMKEKKMCCVLAATRRANKKV